MELRIKYAIFVGNSKQKLLCLIVIFMLMLVDGQREPTVRVIAVSSPPPFRYISVSRGGQITVWNSSLRILRSLGVSD